MQRQRIKIPGLAAIDVGFYVQSGKVADARASSETYVTGRGGQINPHVYAPQGGVSIDTTIVHRSSFWLIGADGRENEIRLSHDFPVRNGHDVSVVVADYGNGDAAYIYAVNHTAGVEYAYADENADMLKKAVGFSPDGSPAIIMGIFLAALVSACILWPGALFLWLLIGALATPPLFYGLKTSAVRELSGRVEHAAVAFFYGHDETCPEPAAGTAAAAAAG